MHSIPIPPPLMPPFPVLLNDISLTTYAIHNLEPVECQSSPLLASPFVMFVALSPLHLASSSVSTHLIPLCTHTVAQDLLLQLYVSHIPIPFQDQAQQIPTQHNSQPLSVTFSTATPIQLPFKVFGHVFVFISLYFL